MRPGILIGAMALAWSSAAGAASETVYPPCDAPALGFGQMEVGWTHLPLSKLKRDTEYKLSEEDGSKVLLAFAEGSASLYAALIKPGVNVPPILSWRWKTFALVPGADNRDKAREDSPVRVIVAFDGDVSTLPEAERKRFKRAKALSGREPPYATLMYIWSEQVPEETVIPSAHTSQVKMVVATSGKSGLGRWHSLRRNLASDYFHAFGAMPGRVLGVAVMTDADNTRTSAVGQYADLRFECAR